MDPLETLIFETKTKNEDFGICLEKSKKGDNLGFFNIHPFGDIKNFSIKSLTMPEKPERRDPLVSPGIVCYAEEKGTFMVQFPWPNGSI